MNIKELYQTIYPLTITIDRYSGTYSGGYFTAWNLNPDQIPCEITCDDTSAMVLFDLIHRGILDLAYGVGDTPDEAAMDLYLKIKGKRGMNVDKAESEGLDMTALEEWKNDFKGYINKLLIPNYNYKRIMEYIDGVPNETKWIPVSEGLPKENGWYQCTVIFYDSLQTMELFYKNGKWLDNRRIDMFNTYDIYGYGNTKEKHKLSYQELFSEFDWTENVIAWKPLSGPYISDMDDRKIVESEE